MYVHTLLIILSLQTLVTFVSLVIILNRYLKSKLTPELLLSIFFFLLTLWGLFFTIGGVLKSNLILATILLKCGLVLGTAGFIFLYFFTVIIFGSRVNYFTFGLLTSLYSVFITSVFVYNDVDITWSNEVGMFVLVFQTHTPRILFFLLATIVGIRLIYESYKIIFLRFKKLLNVSKTTRRQFTLLLLAAYIGIFGDAIGSVIAYFLPAQTRLLPFHILVAISTILILFAYLMAPQVPYIIASRPIMLYVANEDGIPIFSFKFAKIPIDESLFGAIIAALIQFGKHTLKTHEEIKNIRWENLTMTFKAHEYLRFIIISEGYHPLLYKALETFTERFIKKYNDKLSPDVRDITLFKDAVYLVKEAFPFIVID